MFGVTVPLSGESDVHRFLSNARRLKSNVRWLAQSAMCALAVGAILGTLVAVPYDQLFGLSAPLCTALRSSIATAILAGVRATDGSELTFVNPRAASPPEKQA
jgi:hypothetical protein